MFRVASQLDQLWLCAARSALLELAEQATAASFKVMEYRVTGDTPAAMPRLLNFYLWTSHAKLQPLRECCDSAQMLSTASSDVLRQCQATFSILAQPCCMLHSALLYQHEINLRQDGHAQLCFMFAPLAYLKLGPCMTSVMHMLHASKRCRACVKYLSYTLHADQQAWRMADEAHAVHAVVSFQIIEDLVEASSVETLAQLFEFLEKVTPELQQHENNYFGNFKKQQDPIKLTILRIANQVPLAAHACWSLAYGSSHVFECIREDEI